MAEFVLQLEILWPAMVVGLMVLATHVPLGREVLNRGIIFLDLAIAQTAAFGVVLANTFLGVSGHGHDHTFSISLIAVYAAIIGSAVLYTIRRIEIRLQETFIGILFVLMATGIILLLSADPQGGERLKEILVGQILWLQPSDLIQLFIVYSIILGLWMYERKRIGEWLFYPIFAITITLSTQIVGVYLVFASLIIPSVSTLYQKNPLIKAYIIGIAGYVLGLIISASFDLPAGATIVWCLAIIGGLNYVILIRFNSKPSIKQEAQ